MFRRLVDRLWGSSRDLVVRKLAERDPVQRVQNMLAEGVTHQRAGAYAAAVHCYDEALAELNVPDDPDETQTTLAATLYLARGIACRATGRDEQMLSDYTAALRWLVAVPDTPGYDAYALRANARVKTGQMRSGEADYQRFGMVFDPARPTLLPPDLYDHDRAIADCYRALAWQPQLAMAWVCRGWLRDLQGDPVGAARDYEQALRFLPEETSAAERDRFLQLYEETLGRRDAGRLNKREWMAPGYEYCIVEAAPDDGTRSGDHTRIDFRSVDDVQMVADHRALHVMRELMAGEGWQYMASEYEGAEESHYYRRVLAVEEAVAARDEL